MRKISIYIIALLALVLTGCETEMWEIEQPTEVEVYEFYDMLALPGVVIDIYTQDRDGKLPLMIEEAPNGISSYDLLDYKEDIRAGDISFNIENIDITTNELLFVATYNIKIDYEYGFATLEVAQTKIGSSAPTYNEYQASFRITKKLN